MVHLYFIPIGLWFRPSYRGVRISLLQLVLMRFRKVPPSVIVNQMIAGTKAGLHLTSNDLEAHFLAGGNVPNVVTALISAQKPTLRSTSGWRRPSTWPAVTWRKPYRCQSTRK